MKSHVSQARIVVVVETSSKASGVQRMKTRVIFQFSLFHLKLNNYPSNGRDFYADPIGNLPWHITDTSSRGPL